MPCALSEMGTAATLPLRRGRARVGVKRLAACHLRLPPHPHLPPRRGEGAGCITRESCPHVLWPDLDVLLGTYTGWNSQGSPPGKLQPLAGLIGSYFPFPKTRAERQLKHDPRISIEERYAGRDE